MEIHYAAREDLFEAARLTTEAWRWAYKDILDPAYLAALSVEAKHKKGVETFVQGQLLLAKEGGALLGVCKFGPATLEGFAGAGEIFAIYLREDVVGKGYGHALFIRAEEELRERGFASAVLDVLSANERAIRFYRAHGYEKTGDRILTLGGNDYALDVLYKANL